MDIARTKIITLGSIVWVLLNLADTVSTYILLSLGGKEANLVYQWTSNMALTTAMKYIGVALVILTLYKIDRLHWLKYFNLALLLVVLWNIFGIIYLFASN